MGLGLRNCSSWLLLLALVCGPGFSKAGDEALGKHRRQVDWWRDYQRALPGQGSSRWADPVRGYGASRGQAQRGSSGGRAGGLPRQQLQVVSSPVSVQCGEDIMVVSVKRDLYGTGKLVNPSDLSLGPQACKANSPGADTVVFQTGLQDCGNIVQTTQDFLIYSTNLTYNPSSSRNVPITRTNFAVVPIYCYYYRHGNVSSKAIKPTWIPFSSTVSSEEKLSFSLRLMTNDWSGPRPSTFFQLGDVLYIEASVFSLNHINLILFVDGCVATLSPDADSTPQYEIITANGCLVDGVQDDASSAFISPRISSDTLRFTVDVFRFLNVDTSLMYITCRLRVAAATQVPDPMNKACSYSKTTRSWSPVEGSSNICQCCDTQNCNVPSAGTRNWGAVFGRPRRIGKREIADDLDLEVTSQAVLGPLLVIGSEGRASPQAGFSQTVTTSPESRPVELWLLVALASVSVVAAVGLFVIGKRFLSKL